ncbi:hypothetical protein [Arcobacter cloacae]|uniref:hypothetical protein n=1 Tax=Arcobacter cloacae TaxID=1054034 RepID=UPI00155DB25A|nr:hypothetical protein [Arcobacter cloacae]
MSYLDICIIGWNLNALMFVVNFLIAIRVISTQDRSKLHEESLVLKELKEELEIYYPYRTYITILTYVIPFTAFFRMSFRLIEMFFSFKKIKMLKCLIIWYINITMIFKRLRITIIRTLLESK